MQATTASNVVEKRGTIARLVEGAGTLVLDVRDRVSDGGEQGLLGLAFSLDGALAYINFTDVNGDTVVAELAVVGDPPSLDPASMRVLLTIDQPETNHNGGDVLVGTDGMLYIPTGDGGGGGDPDRLAQDLSSLLGKLLRIDPAAPSSGAGAYMIPANNPYIDMAGARPEIWSSGLRNPWRVVFDPLTNDLWIADVGQNQVEQVNVAAALNGTGAGRAVNFGWSAFEGTNEFNSDQSIESRAVV